MALIEWNADMKALTAAVTRIAVALETIVYRQWGITLQPTPPPAPGSEGDERDIIYSSDRETFVRELQDLDAHRNPESVISSDED